jgi:transposase-like protein
MNELSHRGLKDILVAVIDGLKGFPEAISAVYPDCEIQTCIVHLIRNSLSFCNWKERKPVATELKKIYSAETAELAAKRLEDFEQGPLGKKIPAIAQCWRRVCTGPLRRSNVPARKKAIVGKSRVEPDRLQRPSFVFSGFGNVGFTFSDLTSGFEHLA